MPLDKEPIYTSTTRPYDTKQQSHTEARNAVPACAHAFQNLLEASRDNAWDLSRLREVWRATHSITAGPPFS